MHDSGNPSSSECNFILVVWIEGSWVGTYRERLYVGTLVQFAIPLHRFSEEVSYGDFKASSNIKFTWTHCIRMKLYSKTKRHYTLTYFNSVQMSCSLLIDIF